MKITRRDALRIAAGALLAPTALAAPKKKTRGLTPPSAPLPLPPWSYGTSSAATDTVLMFRGNPAHTFYGTGPIPTAPKQLWTFKLGFLERMLRDKPKRWVGTGWTGQAAKLGGWVFIGAVDGFLYALDAETGALGWKLQGGDMFKCSVCVYENRLYIGNVDNHLRCVDAATGELVWSINTGKDLDSSPCVVGDRLYVTGESGYAWCIEPRTGKVIWKTHIGGTGPGTLLGSNGSETSPAVVDGALYAATYDGVLLCLDTATGRIRWKANTGDDTDVSPVVSGGRLVIAPEEAAPFVLCFDLEGRLLWKFDEAKGEADSAPPPPASKERTNGSGTYGGQGYWSTPAVVDGKVYAASQTGRVHRLSLETGAPDWSVKMGASIWSSPCVVDGRVVFGSSKGTLNMLDAATGAEVWSHPLSGGCISTPCIVGGRIYVGDGGGTFHCFG